MGERRTRPEPDRQGVSGEVPAADEVERALARMYDATVPGARRRRPSESKAGKALKRPDEIGRKSG